MLDPISLSTAVVLFVVPKMLDGMLEKFGEELGMKGGRKIFELVGSMKQAIRVRLKGKETELTVLSSDEPLQTEVNVFKADLAKQLEHDPEFLYEMNGFIQEVMQLSPSIAKLIQADPRQVQKFGDSLVIEGELEVEEIIQSGGDGKSERTQEIFSSAKINQTGKAKFGKIQQS